MSYTGSSTPYQIRLELIKQAKDLLEFQYGQKQQELDNIWAAQVADWEKGSSGAYAETHPLPEQAGAPTAEEILEVAEKFNAFVSNGDNGRSGYDVGGLGGLSLSVDTSHDF
jgi:hypothetical protein|tara:strand:- start:367 stop:702 length:336 start_codon:yes stop_codon:yes gene_type:complete